jgi:hypothetical protein
MIQTGRVDQTGTLVFFFLASSWFKVAFVDVKLVVSKILHKVDQTATLV